MADSKRRTSRTARQALAVGCLAAAGTGIGLGVSQATSSTPGFRTALAGTASVTRTLSVTGVLEPVDQATTAFQVVGTVAKVSVTQGQQVTAGQTIASLDPTLLQQQVTAAQSALTAAQAKLAADESGQSTASTGSSAAGTGSTANSSAPASTASAVLRNSAVASVELTSVTTGSTPSGSGSGTGFTRTGSGSAGPGNTGGTSPLASDQQTVVDAQHRADLDLQTAGTALTTAETTCSAETSTTTPASPSTAPSTTTTTPTTSTSGPYRGGTGPRSGGTGFPGGSGTTTTTSPTATSTTPAPGGSTPGSASSACASALAQAQTAQQKVASDQQALARAEAALAEFLASQASTTPGTTRNTGTSAGTAAGAGTHPGSGQTPSRSTATGGSAGSAATQTAPTPAQLASDQATIDSDDASLAQAEQSLNAAVLTSPISGTVASVAVTPGETVSARSSTATITIVNTGSYQTTVSLSTAQVQTVKTGDRVSLTIDGQPGTFHGTVSSIGPVDTSNSSFTYPVDVAIASPTGQLPAGSTTRTTIDVAGATDALVVPTSAVHTASQSLSFVYLDKGGKETRQKVTVGVVGPIYTQIRSGLTRGQAVVLADPSQPVPASNTSATAGGFRAGGAGFGGGGALRNLLRGSGG